MGRKRLNEEEKRVAFNLSIQKKILDEFKSEMEKKEEIPSRIIEDLILKYLKKKEWQK